MIQVVTDIGSSHIAAMAAEVLEGRRVRVLSVESKPSKGVRYGFVEQPSKVAYDIGELVRQLQNSARLPEARQLCVSLNAKTMKQVPLRVTRSLGFGRTVTAPLVDGMLEECYTKFNQPEVAVYDVIPLCYELDGTRMDDPVGRKGQRAARLIPYNSGQRLHPRGTGPRVRTHGGDKSPTTTCPSAWKPSPPPCSTTASARRAWPWSTWATPPPRWPCTRKGRCSNCW